MRSAPGPGRPSGVAERLDDHQAALLGAIAGFLLCGVVALPLVGSDGVVLGLVAGAGAVFGSRRGSRLDRVRSARRG